MTAILPLEVCVSDIPSRLSYSANQASLDLSVCLKVPIQDLVAALVDFQKRQEALTTEVTKSPAKPELKAQTPPGLLPAPSAGIARPHEHAAAAAAPSENMTGPPAIAAAHGPQVSTAMGAAAVAGAPAAVLEATHATTANAGAVAATATAPTAERVPVGLQEPHWNSSISKLQPWYEDYSKKARWVEQPAPFNCSKEKGLKLLRDLMIDDSAKPILRQKEMNTPTKGFDPMPSTPQWPRSEPPSAPPPPDPQFAAASLRGVAGTSPAEPAQEPGAGNAYEPESEEAASNQNAALPPCPQEAPPQPPPGMGNGPPTDNPPPGLAAPAPPGLPAPPQQPPVGRGSPQQQGAANNANKTAAPNQDNCKNQ